MMMEYPANTPARPLGNFACSLGSANANVFAGNRRTLSYIAGGIERVQRNQIASTFPNALGRCSSAFGRSFANVSCAAANVAAGAALLRLGSRLGCLSSLRGLGLSALPSRVLPAERKR
jgi:hypothetical protein